MMFRNLLKKILSKDSVLKSKTNSYCCNPIEIPPVVKKGVVLGTYLGDNNELILTPTTKKFNDCVGGKITELIKESGPNLDRGNYRVFNNILEDYWSVCVVGLGPKDPCFNEVESLHEDRENVRVAAAIGAKKLTKQGCNQICIDGMGFPEQAAEGCKLAVWRYQDNKNRKEWRIVPKLDLFEDPSGVEAWQCGSFKAEAQNLSRKLCDVPANQMTPVEVAQAAISELCPCGVNVKVHDQDWIETKKMDCFLTVAKGSCKPPFFLEMEHCGACPEDKPILYVGKGITYDTGGLCLKSCHHQSRHRSDMSGAATVIAVLKAAAVFNLPVNIIGLVPLCENMPSGMAMKVGDVVQSLNGKSIKIEDTDNDGRLIMADAMVYGIKAYKPKLLIDIATESKGVTAALGSAASGVFTNSHSIWSEIHAAGAITGDRVWRLPYWKFYSRHITRTSSVDVLNKGIGHGDVCLAAAFLGEFVSCCDWLHIDVNGTGMKCHDKVYAYLKRGRMTGRPVRTLIQLMYQLSCDAPCIPRC